jgi:O-antigen/teichoic acid export membrane protein
MFCRVLFRASWTLIDQAVVSLGTFAVNIILARHLTQTDYGAFTLIFGLLLLLQVFNTTLVFYPLTIQSAAPGAARRNLICSCFIFLPLLLLPLSLAIAAGLLIFRHGDLIAPVLVWFVAWQLQEALRRMLFSEFRHRAAVIGDAVSYLGQVVIVALLAAFEMLTLPKVVMALAGTSALAALIQYGQVNAPWQWPSNLPATVTAFWLSGRWSLANSIATALRGNGLIWLIALVSSASQVAEFQAALNVTNVVNPILLGLCNIIPQTAARASGKGAACAWRATREYASLGFLPTVAYCAFVMATPETVLKLLYGTNSHYLNVGLGVKILAVVFVLNYVSEMICSFLHGINSPRVALNINLLGNLTVVIFAIPLVITSGWVGVCVALAISNAMRLLLSCIALRRMIFDADARAV